MEFFLAEIDYVSHLVICLFFPASQVGFIRLWDLSRYQVQSNDELAVLEQFPIHLLPPLLPLDNTQLPSLIDLGVYRHISNNRARSLLRAFILLYGVLLT